MKSSPLALTLGVNEMSRAKSKIHARDPSSHPEDPRGPAICKAVSDQGLSFASGRFEVLINCKLCIRMMEKAGGPHERV